MFMQFDTFTKVTKKKMEHESKFISSNKYYNEYFISECFKYFSLFQFSVDA